MTRRIAKELFVILMESVAIVLGLRFGLLALVRLFGL